MQRWGELRNSNPSRLPPPDSSSQCWWSCCLGGQELPDRRGCGEEMETLIRLGGDTEPRVSWPRELENSFPGPASGSSAFVMVSRGTL